tara:strand:+ start:264 stop:905 length:642 start_codon:yes stop_codon:yes gene_type:complete
VIKLPGIYQVLNLVNGKRYVGSASRLDTRRNTHWCQLRGGYHCNKHFQSAWNLYGEQAFRFEVLLVCDKENLLLYEQRFLDTWNPEYNKCPTAISSLGSICSEETKQRISRAKKGVPHKNKRVGVKFPDKRKRDCARPGERHGMAKLTEQQAKEVLLLCSQGELMMKEIAAQFSVSFSCVADLKYGRSWKHLNRLMTNQTTESLKARVGGSNE